MVTARYLTEKFLEPLREKIRAEGIEEGISEGAARKQREWEDWLRDGREARERGEPFDEPPPSL